MRNLNIRLETQHRRQLCKMQEIGSWNKPLLGACLFTKKKFYKEGRVIKFSPKWAPPAGLFSPILVMAQMIYSCAKSTQLGRLRFELRSLDSSVFALDPACTAAVKNLSGPFHWEPEPPVKCSHIVLLSPFPLSNCLSWAFTPVSLSPCCSFLFYIVLIIFHFFFFFFFLFQYLLKFFWLL